MLRTRDAYPGSRIRIFSIPDPVSGTATLVVMRVYLYARKTWLLTLGVFQAYKVMSTEVEGGGQSQLFKDYYAHNTNGRQAGSLRFGSIFNCDIVNFSRFERDLRVHIEFYK